jgi:hypothetical protein
MCLVRTDISEEHVAPIFRAVSQEQCSQQLAKWRGHVPPKNQFQQDPHPRPQHSS